MVFNSAEFLLFLPLVVLACYLVPRRLKNLWLLLASYFFYLCWNPAHLPVLLFVTAVAYGTGRLLGVARHPRGVLAAGVVLALAPLVGFKYLAFLVDSALAAAARFGVVFAPPVFDWLLPLGISFYTLQAVGYMVDVYRGEPPEKSPLRMALFVAFFPQIVSGPIGRSKSLLAQFRLPQKPRFDDLREGALLMIWGYFLKVVIADRAAIFVDTVYCLDNGFEGWYLIVATVLFGVQLYCDFSGYSDIAVGMGNLLGIRCGRNFDCPYFSRGIKEFWSRWHISLSSWLRDYIYIPLGGNRVSAVRRGVNVLAVFLISGLWHGAGWTFIIWGGIHGIWNLFARKKAPGCGPVRKIWQTLVTFLGVTLGWVFFRAESFGAALTFLKRAVTGFSLSYLDIQNSILPFTGDNTCAAYFLTACGFLFLLFLYERGRVYGKTRDRGETYLSVFWLAVMTVSTVLFGVFGVSGFLYANF